MKRSNDFIHRRFTDAAIRFDRVGAAEPGFRPADVWRSLARARAGLPPAPISRSDDAWPYPLHKLQRGELIIEHVLAIAETDQKTGDRRRVGEALFVAAEQEAVRGRNGEAVKLYERAVAVQAPRHAWKIAAERELKRFKRPR